MGQLNKIYQILKTSFKKDLSVQLSYRLSFFSEIFFALALIIFLFFLSSSFSLSDSSMYESYKGSFFLFSVTGIAMVNLIGQCYSSITNGLREAQSFGYLEEIYSNDNFLAITLSPLCYAFTKSFFRVLLIFIISWHLSGESLGLKDILMVLFISIISTAPFLGIGLLGASIILKFKKGDYLPLLFIGGSMILSGAVYPNEVIPDILKNFANILPLTHSLELLRGMLIQDLSLNQLIIPILWFASLTTIYIFAGMYVFRKVIRNCLRDGSFADY